METSNTSQIVKRALVTLICAVALLGGLLSFGPASSAQAQTADAGATCSISRFWLPAGATSVSNAGWGVKVEVSGTDGRDFNVFGNGQWRWAGTAADGATSALIYPDDLPQVGHQDFSMSIAGTRVDCGTVHLPNCAPGGVVQGGLPVCGNLGAECAATVIVDATSGPVLAVTTAAHTTSITITANGEALATSASSWGPQQTATFEVEGRQHVVLTAADGTWWDCGTVVVPGCLTDAGNEVCSKTIEAEEKPAQTWRGPTVKAHPLVSTVYAYR